MSKTQNTDLTSQQKYTALSVYCLYSIIILFLMVAAIPTLQKIYLVSGNTFLSCLVILIPFLISVFAAILMKLPKKYFGFNAFNAKKFYFISSWSLIFCLVAITAKYLLLTNINSLSSYHLINIFSSTSAHNQLIMWLDFIAYIIFAPFQCFIFHSLFQGGLINLVSIKKQYKAFIVITLSTLFFCLVHYLLGLAFAIMVFLPGLNWTIMYYRHQCIWTIITSHIIIGGVLMCLVGIQPFLIAISTNLL